MWKSVYFIFSQHSRIFFGIMAGQRPISLPPGIASAVVKVDQFSYRNDPVFVNTLHKFQP